MNLVKWIRKNQTKIMTFVVIVLMIVFVGGYSLKQILRTMQIGGEPTIATFGDSAQLKPSHRTIAQGELNVLQAMRMNILLASQRNIKSQLLGLLLFPDSRLEAAINQQLKQAAMQGSIGMNEDEVDKFFLNLREQSDLYWFLLNYEAKQAGIQIDNDDVKAMLKNVIPKLTNGQADAAQLVTAVVEQSRIPEERIFNIVGKMLAVMSYIDLISDTQAVTINEMRNRTALMNEKISADYIEFEAQDFMSLTAEPQEQELKSQLERYSNTEPGTITEQNPYGFGYMLPDRLQVEYAVISLDDIKKLIAEVTPEDMESFYTNNLGRFRYQQKIDPNDPDSETITRTRPYSEVSEQVKNIIQTNRINSRAEIIISDLKEKIEKDFTDIYVRQATSQQLKERSGSYKEAIQETAQKYGIDIYYGKSGWLDRERFSTDSIFGRMGMQSRLGQMVPLDKILFAVEPIEQTVLGKYEVAQPKQWENIGPVRAFLQIPGKQNPGQALALMRITDAKTQQKPDSLDLSYDITGGSLSKTLGDENNRDYFSLRQKVYDDWKLLSAMQKALDTAKELADLVSTKGWEKGLTEINEKYDIAKFEISEIKDRARISQNQILLLSERVNSEYVRNMIHDKMLLDKLYALIPINEFEAVNPLKVLEVEPNAKCYLVKSVSKTPVYRSDYLENKPAIANTFASRTENTAAVELLNPENIFQRLNFKPVTQNRETEEGNTENTEENKADNTEQNQEDS